MVDPPPPPQALPESATVVAFAQLTQCPVVGEPLIAGGVYPRFDTAAPDARRAAVSVPLVMLLALVVSVVAEAANATPPVLVQVIVSVEVVQSPLRLPPANDPDELYWMFPLEPPGDGAGIY